MTSDTTTAVGPATSEASCGCHTPAATAAGSTAAAVPTGAGPCCGTGQAPAEAGACCAPAAKTQAVAARASCC